jgi:hypothetical protein
MISFTFYVLIRYPGVYTKTQMCQGSDDQSKALGTGNLSPIKSTVASELVP